MKRIVLTGPRALALDEVPAPRPGRGEALLRITRVGLCGSDLHLYERGELGRITISEPHVLGHECVGVVEGVGDGSPDTLVGRRVAVEPGAPCGCCRWCQQGYVNLCADLPFLGLPPTHGALQERIVHPIGSLEPLPKNVDDDAGVVLEPMSIALHAIHLAKIRPGQSVAVLGTGVIGTSVVALLALIRGLRIVCVDLVQDRLDRAERLGAEASVLASSDDDPEAAEKIVDLLDGGADIVFECSGSPRTLHDMCEVATAGAHVAVIGSSAGDRVAFSSGSARRKGLTLRFVRRSLHTLAPCVDLAARGLITPGELVTHVLPASRATEGFEMVAARADGVLKALIDMERW